MPESPGRPAGELTRNARVGWVVMSRMREPSRLFRPVRAFKDVMSGRGGQRAK